MQNNTERGAAPCAANDNEPLIDEDDLAVFDAARHKPRLLDAATEWNPPRLDLPRGKAIFTAADGPTVEHRLRAQVAYITSNRYRGQHANDNVDWPLAKQLRAENNEHCLRLAERYRQLFQWANSPTELRGKDLADDVYLMADLRLDESTGKLRDKGTKTVTGKKVPVQEREPKRAAIVDPDKTKKRAPPMPKKWDGDWPLLNRIDATRELGAAQAALGWLREAFEAAVCHGETLEAIGREHGVGNKTGAKGAGRALVYLGLRALDEHWLKPARRAA